MSSMLDIVFLMIAVLFIIRHLYNLFGTKVENRPNIVIRPVDKKAEKELVENITRIINEREKGLQVNEVAAELTELDKDLLKIPDFNKINFLNGARRVFEIVLQAFNCGNLGNIKDLVSKKVWDSLNDALQNRKDCNLTSEVDFICFEKSEIKSVKLLKNSVRIVVEFVSQQVNILKNDKDEIIEGDENFIQKITDMWTFERTLNAKNNRWVLVSTKKTA